MIEPRLGGVFLCLDMALPVPGKINALATLHRQLRYAAHLIAIRDAAVSFPKTICQRSRIALQWRMPTLTRKRVNDRPLTWHVHYAGVRVGVIVERSGAPPSSHQWQWCCGFYPGGWPGDDRHGTAASFEAARAAFEAAWHDYLPNLKGSMMALTAT